MSRKKVIGWATPLPHGKVSPEGMRLWIILAFILFCAVSQAEDKTVSRIRPVDLRCEYLSAPLGIDVKQPRLSWKLRAKNPKERGQAQSVYQILVAGSR